MAQTASEVKHGAHGSAPAHDDHSHHPAERQYWVVFAILFVLTAVEVAWSYIGVSGAALVIPLLLMMLAKFLLVAGAFMHLYYDLKILNGNLFTWAFGGSMVLAVAVFFAMFAAFEFTV